MANFLSGACILVATVLGVTLAFSLDAQYHPILEELWPIYPRMLLAVLFGGFGYLVAATFAWEFQKWFDEKLPQIRLRDFFWGTVGSLMGLLVANGFLLPTLLFMTDDAVKAVFASNPVVRVVFPVVVILLPLAINFFCGYLGAIIFLRKQQEIRGILMGGAPGEGGIGRVLDTSVIIDGRIHDLVKSSRWDGPIEVPAFVLAELQLISDHSDELKRKRGRSGLATLEKLKEDGAVDLLIIDEDYPDIREVDDRLVHYCAQTGKTLVTCDMALDKIASLRGVRVINIHAIARALRPIVMPGETLEVSIVHEGKGKKQGVGYLEDGTMVVVEDGFEAVGHVRLVKITKVHSTQAGRMLFSKLA